MNADDIYQSCVDGFSRRKFSAGLLVAFIDFLIELESHNLGISSFQDLLRVFPRQERTASGATANTLVVLRPDATTLSIRPFYNQVEIYFRSQHHRFDYPSCAPHATQAWRDYQDWLDGLCRMNVGDLNLLRAKICNFVLDTLPDQSFDPNSVQRDPPIFEMILSSFDLASSRGEPTGAAYQGVVFGFLRADNPHLQIEVDKVRTGSKRLQRVGDIDGWDGSRLAVTAEVKQYTLNEADIQGLRGFFNEANRRAAIGIVAAIEFEGEARRMIQEAGMYPLSQADLLSISGLWDPAKQKIATSSLLYYVHHVEKNSALKTRLQVFLETLNAQVDSSSSDTLPDSSD
jgi:hypothetical protein